MADSMIDGVFDIVNRTQTGVGQVRSGSYLWSDKKDDAGTEDKSTLSFTDMLGLMVAQFQNQTIDNQASTTDMMNQLVQMSVMQAMTDMTTQMKELATANVMSYSASLVGQTVTLGVYDENGKLHEIVGKVDGAGTYDGQQVIFVKGKSYLLSSIMAVGTLPDVDGGTGEDSGESGGDGGNTGETGETEEA